MLDLVKNLCDRTTAESWKRLHLGKAFLFMEREDFQPSLIGAVGTQTLLCSRFTNCASPHQGKHLSLAPTRFPLIQIDAIRS